MVMINFSPYTISLIMLFHCGQIRSLKKNLWIVKITIGK